MTHRGPDDAGMHIDGAADVGLGARRLSILDVPGGHQPLSNEEGTVWAVLNGEIYNHRALRTSLRERGHNVRTGTDTEVLVHLYEAFGDDLVHALEGMFAFAVWDATRRRLLIGRDRFGEKPLFFHESAGVLTFASEVTALRRGVGGLDDIDPAAVNEFFVHGYLPPATCIVSGVRELPPAHILTWDASDREVRVRQHWQARRVDSAPEASPRELIAETVALLDDSVRSRLIADVPVGVFLSGGLDSTLVAALAGRHSSGALQTFTVGYDRGTVDETDAARHTAHVLGSAHHELILTGTDVERLVPTLLARLDQPIADPALVAAHAIAKAARQTVTVAVGGEGADEVFGGYPRYRWLPRVARTHGFASPALLRAAARAGHLPGAGRLGRLAATGPPGLRQVEWVTGGRRSARASLYGPRLSGTIADDEYGPLSDRLAGEGSGTLGSALMEEDQRHWLPGDVLAKADRAGMLASLEVRTPFLDRRLVEFAAGVSAATHLRGGGKFLLRSALREVLPAAPRRSKTAFRVPAADWLRGPLAPVLANQLRGGAIFDEGWFDRGAVSRLAGEHAAGITDGTSSLWPLLCLGLWLDTLRGRPAS